MIRNESACFEFECVDETPYEESRSENIETRRQEGNNGTAGRQVQFTHSQAFVGKNLVYIIYLYDILEYFGRILGQLATGRPYIRKEHLACENNDANHADPTQLN